MNKAFKIRLQYRRATLIFFLGYLVISLLGAIIAILSGTIMGMPLSIAAHNPSYILYENFLVALNLIGWVPLSLLYFVKRDNTRYLRSEALLLGIFWAVIAVILDYVLYVLVQSPLYISAHDFYIGQFPWIYIIYVIVLISPLCIMELKTLFSKRLAAAHFFRL